MLLPLLLVALTILAAVAPAVLYSLLIWWLDRYEKEPWGLLGATFVWGAIPAVCFALMGEFILEIPFSCVFGEAAGQVIGGSVVAPVVEEVVKGFAVFVVFLVFRREFDGLLDGIVYGALVGFGFGMTENAFYFVGGFLEGGAADWLLVVFLSHGDLWPESWPLHRHYRHRLRVCKHRYQRVAAVASTSCGFGGVHCGPCCAQRLHKPCCRPMLASADQSHE